MSNIQIFNFKEKSVRTVLINDAVMFVAKDVAECLGYERPSDAISQHCKKSKSLKSLGYGDLAVNDIISEFGTTSINVIPESDVYRLVMRSKLESAESFQDWVVDEVLPSIRKTGSYSATAMPHYQEALPATSMVIQIAESAARMLRMSDTSKIRMLAIICEENGVSTKMLPNYSDEQLTKALGDLLKDHGSSLSAIAANKILMELGLLEELERRSTGTKVKKFKSIVGAGLNFGKNETSTQSPNETQPRWFVDKFKQVLELIEAA